MRELGGGVCVTWIRNAIQLWQKNIFSEPFQVTSKQIRKMVAATPSDLV